MNAFAGFSQAGFKPNFTHCVHLVRSTQDAVRMGATPNRVYTTFQNAYNAANALQIILGGITIVTVLVYDITAAESGDLTFEEGESYNQYISICGLNKEVSMLGNINIESEIGDGTMGVIMSEGVSWNGVTIGNINGNFIGTLDTGKHSATINLNLKDCLIGDISVRGCTYITHYINWDNSISTPNFRYTGSIIGIFDCSSLSDDYEPSGFYVGNLDYAGNIINGSATQSNYSNASVIHNVKKIGNYQDGIDQILLVTDLKNVDFYANVFVKDQLNIHNCNFFGNLKAIVFQESIATGVNYISNLDPDSTVVFLNNIFESRELLKINFGNVPNIQLLHEQTKYVNEFGTNNNTITTILSIPVPTGTMLNIKAEVSGKSGNNRVYGLKAASIRNNSGTLSLLGSVTNIIAVAAEGTIAAATFTITFSGTNALVRVTGVTGVGIDWVCAAKYTIT